MSEGMPLAGSLFSGIGGGDLGLERAGFKVAWQVEQDEYCTRVLHKHWPDVPKYRDVREVGAHNLGWVHLIHGGVPCQPSSVAGRRQGQGDDRWMWHQFLRIVGEIKPDWVLAENPPGVLSVDAGRGFGTILRDLAQCGYDAEWGVFRASDFGAPHIRARLFLIAYRGNRSHTTRPTPRILANPRHWAERVAAQPWRTEASELGQGGTYVAASATTQRLDSQHRMGNGIPNRVDRLRGLGNAEVPQVVEWLGRRIVEALR